jgi:hypothetical protein
MEGYCEDDTEQGSFHDEIPDDQHIYPVELEPRFRPVSPKAVEALIEHTQKFAGDLPIRAMKKYRRDVQIIKKCGEDFQSVGRPKGAIITRFSGASARRLLHFVRNVPVDFRSMLTITYPRDFPRDGIQVKRDLNRFQKWLVRQGTNVQGVWFLEFQGRGAPHFHFLLTLDLSFFGSLTTIRRTGPPRGQKSEDFQTCKFLQDKASKAWFRIVGSGDEKHLRAGVCWELLEHEEGAQRYASDHAMKMKQKTVPLEFRNVGRFWGVLGGLKLPEVDEEPVTSEEVISRLGTEVISRNGRVKKHLWYASEYVESPSPR